VIQSITSRWKKLIHYLLSEPREHMMSVFLGLLCIEVFVFGPLSRAQGPLVSVINGIAFSFLLIVGVIAMAPSLLVQVSSATVVAIAIVLRWLANFQGPQQFYLWDKITSLAATLVFLALVLWQVYKERPVTAHKIMGAVAAYLLVAIMFALLYNIIELLHPGAFSSATSGYLLQAYLMDEFLYFSIATLTTVGFGDITAVHPFARSLVMLESSIGILYPPILIGVLVSLHTERLRGKTGKSGQEGDVHGT
jgi:Ion channel